MAGPPVIKREVAGRAQVIGAPGFVGRERELAAVSQALARGPAVVLIEGEAGIGKSTLLREYLASAGEGERVLVGRCPPFRQPHTLGPVADAVRQAADRVSGLPLSALCGALRPLFPEWADDLPPVPEPAEDPTAARHRLFRSLAELVGCLRVRLEDAQWADEATIEFFLYLATQQRLPVSLVVTFRPEEVADGSLLLRLLSRRHGGATQLRFALGPLDVATTAQMVTSMLAMEQPPAEFAEFVHKRTDGVPLAVEELVRLLGDRADLAVRNGHWVRRHLDRVDVPSTIRDAVLERTERLTGETQAVLRAAAVLAYPADQATLLASSGLAGGRGSSGLAGALRCGMLAEDGRGQLSFRHVLASRAVYEAIPGPERRMMHLRAGRALEERDPPPTARLARHFHEEGETVKWRRYAEHAADLAIAAGDVATAIALLHSLLTDADLPLRAVIGLTEKIPAPLVTGDPRFQDVIRALRSALAAGVPDRSDEAELRCQLGRVLYMMEEFDAACEELERAIPHLSHKPVNASWAMTTLGWARGPGTATTHMRWLQRAAEISVPVVLAASVG